MDSILVENRFISLPYHVHQNVMSYSLALIDRFMLELNGERLPSYEIRHAAEKADALAKVIEDPITVQVLTLPVLSQRIRALVNTNYDTAKRIFPLASHLPRYSTTRKHFQGSFWRLSFRMLKLQINAKRKLNLEQHCPKLLLLLNR